MNGELMGVERSTNQLRKASLTPSQLISSVRGYTLSFSTPSQASRQVGRRARSRPAREVDTPGASAIAGALK
jgi:hypothetical protein